MSKLNHSLAVFAHQRNIILSPKFKDWTNKQLEEKNLFLTSSSVMKCLAVYHWERYAFRCPLIVPLHRYDLFAHILTKQFRSALTVLFICPLNGCVTLKWSLKRTKSGKVIPVMWQVGAPVNLYNGGSIALHFQLATFQSTGAISQNIQLENVSFCCELFVMELLLELQLPNWFRLLTK